MVKNMGARNPMSTAVHLNVVYSRIGMLCDFLVKSIIQLLFMR